MKILALETSTAACSVALRINDESHELFEVSGSRHSELLLPMVERIMGEAALTLRQCDALAFGEGPGSFTGLRVGVGVAQGLAFGADIPVIPVSSLLAQANRYSVACSLCAFDARMGQLYWGLFRSGPDGLMESITGVDLSGPEKIDLDRDREWTAVGTGCDRYRSDIRSHNPSTHIDFIQHGYPHALDVARIAVGYFSSGRVVSAVDAAPRYVRNKVTN